MIRLLIVDNTRVNRKGLAALLDQETSIAAAQVASQPECLDSIKTGHPDIVLLRTCMPECVPIIRSIAKCCSRCKGQQLGFAL